MEKVFFNNWDGIFRTLIIGVLAYFSLILMLRISGKRTLSQMKEFDFIVTIALGSTLATVLLNKSVPLLEGLVALGLLILLQYILASSSISSKKFSNLISSEPSLLFYNGQYRRKAMKIERVTEAEVISAIRSAGINSPADVAAVVLESNGKFSVIRKDSGSDSDSSIKNVKQLEQD